MEPSIERKEALLRAQLQGLPNALIAYSGGVDSAYLLWTATKILGSKCLGVLADSPSLKRSELEHALHFAQTWSLPVRVIKTEELANPDYTANPLNRCYHCKYELFEQIKSIAEKEEYSTICYGENLDDASEFRPGQEAAKTFQVLAPLRDAGLTKQDIRSLALQAGLSVADKVAQPCLSSRIPHGAEVTVEKLRQIEQAEAFLEKEGFNIYRVRHHGKVARVQVSPQETLRLLDPLMREKIRTALNLYGFSIVEFDQEGYSGASLR